MDFSTASVCSPTAELGVLVQADDAVRPLGGVQQRAPGQGTGVAQLGVVVQQNQTSADAA